METNIDEQKALLRSALRRLVNICEQIGDGDRYWPREIRLDGSDRELNAALDEAVDMLGRTE